MNAPDAAARDWLALASVPGIGPVLGRRLAGALGGPERALSAPPTALEALGVAPKLREQLSQAPRADLSGVDTWLAAGPERHLIAIDSPTYPQRLRALVDAPLALLVAGDLEVLALPQLGVVGSRSPTAGGVDTARRFSRALAERGLIITSGLARGIDGAAHRGALDADVPTVAVLGHGPDRVYPDVHASLADAIVAGGGALVSEFLPGTPPERSNFPRRNRTIAGLSLGVLVVEAAVRSGSLITARQAMEQGREVFAVPGSIHNPTARGCHRLIRDGAKLVETVDDVLEELAGQLPPSARPEPAAGDERSDSAPELDDDYVTLLHAMGFDPVSVDELVQRTGLTPQALSSMLFRLELEGEIRPVSGVGYERVGTRE